MKDILLSVFLVLSPDAVSMSDAVSISEVAISKFTEVGIPLKLKSIKKIRAGKAARWHRLSTLFYELASYEKRFQRKRRGVLYVMLLPYHQAGKDYLAGISTRVCGIRKNQGIGIGTGETSNQAGDDRKRHSAITLAHETAHTLGSKHSDGRNPVAYNLTHEIMCADPLPFVDEDLKFSIESVSEIKECLNGR